ncbi:MAG: Fe-S cluster assembly ATPase SufC [Nitrospirota bacterium]
MKHTLKIENLHVEAEGKKILKGINLEVKSGEIHAIMGPNGSGKSTLCNAIMGHPRYTITKGKVTLNGKNILKLDTNKRANLGLFLSFQHPTEIAGVPFSSFLRLAKNANLKANQRSRRRRGKKDLIRPVEFLGKMKETAQLLDMNEKLIERSVNEGFSGGEKKKAEIAQMAILEPNIAMLDEIDSGLDIDALKTIAKGIKKVHKNTNLGLMLITHYQRILDHITPNYVHIIKNGEIVKSGTASLALELEKKGYKAF